MSSEGGRAVISTYGKSEGAAGSRLSASRVRQTTGRDGAAGQGNPTSSDDVKENSRGSEDRPRRSNPEWSREAERDSAAFDEQQRSSEFGETRGPRVEREESSGEDP
jgi:hypothetical protein